MTGASQPEADTTGRTEGATQASLSPDDGHLMAGDGGEGLSADPARLADMIGAIAELGRDDTGAVSRLGFGRDERRAHELVRSWLADIGLETWQDAIGNTIAELPGNGSAVGAIGTGSHLDSVPHGGRFDGIAGVVTAVEALRVAVDNDLRFSHPIRVVAFAAEEGARFGEPCIGSKATAGRWNPADLDRLRDVHGVTAAQAMREVGLDPERVASCRWDPAEWAGFLELHIEQAPVLASEGIPIGLVDLVSGSTRVEFILEGRAQHSGGTTMRLRRDALMAASEVLLFAERLAGDPRYRGARTTVGRLEVFPNSITTIPGQVRFVLDLRDIDSDRQRRGAREIVMAAQRLCERRGIQCSYEVIADSSPAVLSMWLREITMASCEELGVPYRVMTSGASHDSQIVSSMVPSAMIFVPSKDGLSHVPEEWTSSSDLAMGATVLLDSLRRLDDFLERIPATRPETHKVGS